MCFLYLTINPVSRVDRGGYILTAYRDGPSLFEDDIIFLLIAYPPGEASCVLSEEYIDGDWFRLHCTASLGSIKGLITCYQDGIKIPPLNSPQELDETISQTLLAKVGSLVYCCSSTLDGTKDRCDCKDSVWDPDQNEQVTNVTDPCPPTIPKQHHTFSELPIEDNDVSSSPSTKATMIISQQPNFNKALLRLQVVIGVLILAYLASIAGTVCYFKRHSKKSASSKMESAIRKPVILEEERHLLCKEYTGLAYYKMEQGQCKDYAPIASGVKIKKGGGIDGYDVVLEDDQNVVKDGHCVITLVPDKLDKPLDEGGVKHITHTVSGVRFVKGVGREKYNGRIDGYDGKWKLSDTISVKDKITFPAITGCIDEFNVIIADALQGSQHTYMLDMNTKQTQLVITGSNTSRVVPCAFLNDDKVVCRKRRECCTGDSFTGCISVYDRQWKLINDVTIPRNTTHDVTWVDVAADRDGMIIAAEVCQSKIYIINPADGKIMNTITCKEDISLCGVLASGHIIVQPDSLRVFIVDRKGAQREIIHSDVIWNVCIDRETDDLYVVTSDKEFKTCMIDQVMSGGDMRKTRVASFPLSTRLTRPWNHLFTSRVIMTSSGNMIASDGANILIFKKMFSL